MKTLKSILNLAATAIRLVLAWILEFPIQWKWFSSNQGKFKAGDKVKYNFIARIILYPAIKNDLHWLKILRVDKRENGTELVIFYHKSIFGLNESCDPIWLRHLRFYESSGVPSMQDPPPPPNKRKIPYVPPEDRFEMS